MPFLRYANARVVGPRLQGAAWDNVRVAAGNARSDRNLVEQASKILKADFDPKNFLLTHATIVASVDTVLVKNARLGTFTENGKKIVRKTSNFRIKPECDALINNNLDCWSRDVLLKSYKTFIGAHSFCFAPGTDVQMGDGTYRPIEDICVGDSVITHTGEVRQVTHTFERDYEGPIRAIRIGKFAKTILATGNHPFRVLSVDAPPLTSYGRSKLSSQVRYRSDQIASALRDGAHNFGSAFPLVRKVKEHILLNGPSLAGDVAEALGYARTYGPVILKQVLKRHADQFVSRPLAEQEHSALKKGRSRIRVWGVREDAPNLPSTDISAEKAWVPAEDLATGTYLLGAERKVGCSTDWGKATLLGYYLAEGCRLSPHKNYGVSLCFGAHERHLVEHAARLAEESFPGTRAVIQAPSNGALRVSLYGAEIDRWMVNHGGVYSESKRLHPDVFLWDNETLLRMLAAWMAGDGDHHKGTLRLRGATTSRALGEQMQYVAERCAIKSSLVFTRKRIGEVTNQVVMVVGGEPQYFDVIPRHHLWTLLVSKDSTSEIALRTPRWGAALYDVNATHKRQDFAWWGDCRVHRVTSNESHPYKGKVYNLEVEGDHSYVVTHGIAVHNCEHVQIEDLSKGRIIDAVARDVGDSVYVDILVANDRKHTDLIESIESGRLSTLSMGCFLPGTQVSLADGTRVAIEDVQVGDMVLTHKGRAREVLNKQIRGGKWGVQRIEAVGVPSAITATDIHPFFVLDPSLGSLREVQAQNLQVGDLLSNPGGTAGASITSIVPQTYEGWVHDMEVEEDHSYVVEGVAVHNCSIDGSTCTKCGHWAADETEFCECVKYSKGNTFYDEGGQRHRIAELCGDVSLDPTGGVTFIEASWVAVPAFTGAVARNVITVSEKSDPEKKTARRIRRVFNQPSPRIDPNAMKKAAFDLSADMFDEPEEAAPAEEKPAAPAPAVSPLDGIQDQLKKTILDKVKDELLAELTKSRLNEQLSSPPATPTDPNDSVIKQARSHKAGVRVAYRAAVREIVKTASCDADVMNRLATLNGEMGVSVPHFVYRAALKVGSPEKYRTLNAFVSSCKAALGREPNSSEAKTLLRLATILSASSINRRPAE